MLRRERWWVRELERRERAWEAERAQLVATVCHLAGKPLPTVAEPEPAEPEFEYEPDLVAPEYLTLP